MESAGSRGQLSVSLDPLHFGQPPPGLPSLSASMGGSVEHKPRSHPAMARVKEFGSQSPSLRRLQDPEAREEERKRTNQREEDEKRVRILEQNPALAPSRGRPFARQGSDRTLRFVFNAEKTVVSHSIKLAELRYGGWYFLEERFLQEFDCIRETSLKLLFGKQEKPTRIGLGSMEETVFTVAPFKDSRVELPMLPDVPPETDSTFYNASWIGREFIAAAMPQGNVPRAQFWRMIWEYDVPTVVMLNDDGEGKRRHSDITRYWPNELNEWEKHGLIEVMKTEQVAARGMSSTVRKIVLRHIGEPGVEKHVDHVQYRDWPDGGIPADRRDYQEFIFYLLNLSRRIREGDPVPVVVHCFGGKGRTGTTIAILLELQKLEQFCCDEVDICGTVSEMRMFRSLLVETLEQYKFVYATVLTMVTQGRVKGQWQDLFTPRATTTEGPKSSEF